MSAPLMPTAGPGDLGLWGDDLLVPVIVRGGSYPKGSLLMFDIGQTDAGGNVTNNIPGDENSGLVNVVSVVAGTEGHGIFVILKEAIAEDQKGKAYLRGFNIDALCYQSGGSTSLYDRLYADAGSTEPESLDPTGPAATENFKILALALEAVADTDPGVLQKVWFDGFHGFSSTFLETP